MRHLTLASIKWRNFKSFCGEHELQFPQKPGISFFYGLNGSGKSTIIDALVFAGYGQSVEGLKGGDLCTDYKMVSASLPIKETETVIDLGNAHISRKWSSGKLTINPGNPEATLGLTHDQFMAAVVFGQAQPLFIDLDASSRLEVFEDLLGLEIYLAASNRAQLIGVKLTKQLQRLELAKARVEGQLTALPDIAVLDQEIEQSKETYRQYVLEQNQRRETVTKELAETNAAHKTKTLELAELAKSIAAFDETAKLVSSCKLEESQQAKQLAVLESQIKQHRENFTALVKTSKCPTCGQPIPVRQGGSTQAEFERKGAELVKQKQQLDYENLELCKAIAEAEINLEERDILLTKRGELTSELTALHTRRLNLQTSIDQQDNNLANLQKQIDQAQGRRDKTLKDKQLLDEQLIIIETLRAKLATKQGQAEALQGYFKDMRLLVVARVLDHLSIESNAQLPQWGLGNTRLIYSSTQVNKSGTTKPALTISIERNGSTKPFKAYSPGERQKLRLADAMGLANVIQAIANVQYGFEVWDEPSSWLDDETNAILPQVLYDRAQRYNKRILLIEHSLKGEAVFDHVVHLGKDHDAAQSRIIDQQVYQGE